MHCKSLSSLKLVLCRVTKTTIWILREVGEPLRLQWSTLQLDGVAGLLQCNSSELQDYHPIKSDSVQTSKLSCQHVNTNALHALQNNIKYTCPRERPSLTATTNPAPRQG